MSSSAGPPTLSVGTAAASSLTPDTEGFNPKRVLILSKITRYEFEKSTNGNADDAKLEKLMNARGSNFRMLKEKHQQHAEYVRRMEQVLQGRGIETKVVQRREYNQDAVEWADAVFSAGGDGTFLMAASKIRSRSKPLIGVNTDPSGSEGHLCIQKKSADFEKSIDRLFNEKFQWTYRHRIRVRLSGRRDRLGECVELHDEQLNRWPDQYRWTPEERRRTLVVPSDAATPNRDGSAAGNAPSAQSQPSSSSGGSSSSNNGPPMMSPGSEMGELELPVLALNEVFVGESLSSRVSYYEFSLNDQPAVKQKSSGITVSTGTGSTSWFFNINKLTPSCVAAVLDIAQQRLGVNLNVGEDPTAVADICRLFNERLVFAPTDPRMAFCVRDAIFNKTFPATPQRGFADRLKIRSRCYDAHLVVDGGLSYRFNNGTAATMEVHPEDALCTVQLR